MGQAQGVSVVRFGARFRYGTVLCLPRTVAHSAAAEPC